MPITLGIRLHRHETGRTSCPAPPLPVKHHHSAPSAQNWAQKPVQPPVAHRPPRRCHCKAPSARDRTHILPSPPRLKTSSLGSVGTEPDAKPAQPPIAHRPPRRCHCRAPSARDRAQKPAQPIAHEHRHRQHCCNLSLASCVVSRHQPCSANKTQMNHNHENSSREMPQNPQHQGIM